MNKEILDSLPRVKCKNELDALRKDGAFEAIVKETKTIWKYCHVLLQWNNTGKSVNLH